jgi:hypothetical protein
MASIVDIGRALKSYGFDIGEHPEFGGVSSTAHSQNSHHHYGEAIDVGDWRADQGPEYEGGTPLHWKERTRRLAERGKQLGIFNEVFGPQDNNGHDTHVHKALRGKAQGIDASHLEWLATGRHKKADGNYTYDMPQLALGGSQSLGASATAGNQLTSLNGSSAEQTKPAVPDWRAAASDPSRSTNPNEAAYWQREDIKQWAAANPQLAKPLMAAAHGQPAAADLSASADAFDFKPIDRGALNGTRRFQQ